jgi:hypothetical protein
MLEICKTGTRCTKHAGLFGASNPGQDTCAAPVAHVLFLRQILNSRNILAPIAVRGANPRFQWRIRRLFLTDPHADDFHRPDIVQNLVNRPMLDIDSPRAGAGQVTHRFLVRRRRLTGIFSEKFEQALGLGLETGAADLPGIALRLLGEYQPRGHRFNSSTHWSTGVLSPLRIDA